MAIDHDECYRALCARDPRQDGRFFICVHTTGIFCRPICPARTPKRENVQFVESAEAALELGFRACKRCRPEVKAGSAAWDLKGASLRRALRMIEAGALDSESIDDFAGRLGIGARHLRRIIKTSLGVAPNRLALARRAAFARNLIETGSLSMTEIAAASGFGSLRRFNDVILKEFGTSPTGLRTQAKPSSAQGSMTLELRAKGAMAWSSLQAFYAARVIAGVEHAEVDQYARILPSAEGSILLTIRPLDEGRVKVELVGAEVGDLFAIVTRIRRALDLDTDVVVVAQALRSDSVLRPVVDRIGSLRLPGAWDPFELAVRALLGQQVSVKAARTLAYRLVHRYGRSVEWPEISREITHEFPRPEVLAKADLPEIISLGLTSARAKALVGLSKATLENPAMFVSAESLGSLIARFSALDGVGPWTAHYIALRAFGEADAFPASDLGLRKAYGALSGEVPSAAELEKIAANWSPWRGYAAQYLWTYGAMLEGRETNELAA